MGRFITNAGTFYAYVAGTPIKPLGVGGSLVALVSYNAMQVGIYGLFGFRLSAFIEAEAGFASPWWVWVLLCIVVVGVLGVNRVDLSAKVLGTLVALGSSPSFCSISSRSRPPLRASRQPRSTRAPSSARHSASSSYSVSQRSWRRERRNLRRRAKDPKRTYPERRTWPLLSLDCSTHSARGRFSVGIGPSQVVVHRAAIGPRRRVHLHDGSHERHHLLSCRSSSSQASSPPCRRSTTLSRATSTPSVARVWCHAEFSHTNKSGAPWAGSGRADRHCGCDCRRFCARG